MHNRIPLNIFGDSVHAAILKASGLSSLGLNTPTAAKQGFCAIYFPTWNQHILPNHYIFKCGIAGTSSLLEKDVPPLDSSCADFTKPVTTPILHQAVMGTSQTAIRDRIPKKNEVSMAMAKSLPFSEYKYFYTGSIFCSTAVVPFCPKHPQPQAGAILEMGPQVPHLLQEDVHHAVEIKNGLAPPAAWQGGHEGVVGDHICLEASRLKNTSTRNPGHLFPSDRS